MICSPSKPITIPRKNNDYSLNKNIFDPIGQSPPNEFLIKLQKRMSVYESLEKPQILKMKELEYPKINVDVLLDTR